MTSTGNMMTVKFRTDERDAGRGFNATWRELTPLDGQGNNNIDRITYSIYDKYNYIRYIYYNNYNHYNRDNLHKR